MSTDTASSTRAASASAPDVRRSVIAVAMLFFVNGLVFSNFLPRIPEVKERIGVANTGLGASLLGGGLGGFVAAFVVSRALRRYSTRTVLTFSALIVSAMLPVLGQVRTPVQLLGALFVLGCFDVLADMAMNAQGVMVQDRLGRPIMQRLHGAWSLGFTVGSGGGLIASRVGLGIGVHFAIVGVVMVIAVLAVRPHLLPVDDAPDASAASTSGRSTVRSLVLAMGAMAIGVSLLESMPNDWSAITMKDVFGADKLAGIGTVIFAGSMLLGRLTGDHARVRIGDRRFLPTAVALAAVGVTVVAVARNGAVGLAGFSLWGLGVSVMFPQLYELAAKLPGVAAGSGLGAMAIGQRLGFTLAPVTVGWLSDRFSLQRALFTLGALAVVVITATRRVVRGGSSRG